MAFERGNSAPGQSWLPRTCGEDGGRRGEHTSKRPASRGWRSCALPATIKRQSRGPAGYNQEAIKRPSGGNQEAIKRQSRGNQEAINDAPRSCALRAGQRAIRRIGLRRRRALGPARRSESRLMRRAISMHSEGISRETSSVAISMQSACNQHAFRGDLKGGIIRGNPHAISVDLKVAAVDLDVGRVIHHQRYSSVISGHQRSSSIIRGDQRSSSIIRGTHPSSVVIRGHHPSSVVIRGHHPSSEVIRGHHPSSEVITAVN